MAIAALITACACVTAREWVTTVDPALRSTPVQLQRLRKLRPRAPALLDLAGRDGANVEALRIAANASVAAFTDVRAVDAPLGRRATFYQVDHRSEHLEAFAAAHKGAFDVVTMHKGLCACDRTGGSVGAFILATASCDLARLLGGWSPSPRAYALAWAAAGATLLLAARRAECTTCGGFEISTAGAERLSHVLAELAHPEGVAVLTQPWSRLPSVELLRALCTVQPQTEVCLTRSGVHAVIRFRGGAVGAGGAAAALAGTLGALIATNVRLNGPADTQVPPALAQARTADDVARACARKRELLAAWRAGAPPRVDELAGRELRGSLLRLGPLWPATEFITHVLFGAGHRWLGKQLDADGLGGGSNRFAGGRGARRFAADVQPSVLDGRPALVLRYRGSDWLWGGVLGMRDEIRCVQGAPNVLVGIGGMRATGGMHNGAPFLLEVGPRVGADHGD